MNWRIAGTVLAKELTETLRDRRTLFIMIVVPAFLYPALFVVMEQLALFGQRSLEGTAVRVAVVDAEPEDLNLSASSRLRLVPLEGEPAAALRNERVDAIVLASPVSQAEGGTSRVQILFDGSRERSSFARAMVQNELREWSDTLLARRLEAARLPREFVIPLAVRDSSIATAREVGGYALGRFLPLILILMTVLGAFYPAIDLAAGEKERGTLEPLLTVPVEPDELVAGKFAAVSLIALAAATLNLGSMLLTFQSGIFKFSQAVDINFALPLRSILLIFGVLVLLAILFASLFLGIAVRSHSFKEAQNALTPVYIVSFLPAMLASMPGIEFTPTLAMVPIAGVALLFRSLVTESAETIPTLVAFTSTVFYALAALVFAVRAFGREDVLFGTPADSGPGGTLGARFRRWSLADGAPTAGWAFAFAGGIALLSFYFGAAIQLRMGEAGLLVTQLLLIGAPAVLLARFGPMRPMAALPLRPVGMRTYAAALLLIAGAIPVGWLLAWLQSFFLEIPPELLVTLQGLLQADSLPRVLWLLFLVALVPAVCEELAFRGMILQGLQESYGKWGSIVLGAGLFGLFHLSMETAIRFLPTFWLGLVLGYVVWNTRSLFPSMLQHLVNNGMAVLLVSSPALREVLLSAAGQPRWWVIVLAPLALVAGHWLLPKRARHIVQATRSGEEPPLAAEPLISGTGA